MLTQCSLKWSMPAQHNTSLELFSLDHLTRFLWLQSVSDVLYSVITVSNIEKIFVKHTCITWSICWRNSVLVISHEWSPEQCLSIVWERRWLWWTRHARCWSQDTAERDNVEWHTSVRTRSLVSDLRRESWSVLTTRHTLATHLLKHSHALITIIECFYQMRSVNTVCGGWGPPPALQQVTI